MMSRVKNGIVAGFVATLVISVLEAINIFALNSMFQPFPGMVASLLGMDGNLAAGWAIHLFSGTFILGALFGVLCPRLPTDTAETKGIVFAVGAWVVMMLGVFFIGDSQVLGSNMATLGWMLVTHIVFGIVLGTVYSRLVEREKRGHAVVGAQPVH